MLAIPTLVYGLELTHLIETQSKLLNKGRKALKQPFNISAHSRNYLNAILNIESVSTTINNNKLKLMYRLMNNEITLNIIV